MKDYIVPIVFFVTVAIVGLLIPEGTFSDLPNWLKDALGLVLLYLALKWVIKDAVKEVMEELREK